MGENSKILSNLQWVQSQLTAASNETFGFHDLLEQKIPILNSLSSAAEILKKNHHVVGNEISTLVVQYLKLVRDILGGTQPFNQSNIQMCHHYLSRLQTSWDKKLMRHSAAPGVYSSPSIDVTYLPPADFSPPPPPAPTMRSPTGGNVAELRANFLNQNTNESTSNTNLTSNSNSNNNSNNPSPNANLTRGRSKTSSAFGQGQVSSPQTNLTTGSNQSVDTVAFNRGEKKVFLVRDTAGQIERRNLKEEEEKLVVPNAQVGGAANKDQKNTAQSNMDRFMKSEEEEREKAQQKLYDSFVPPNVVIHKSNTTTINVPEASEPEPNKAATNQLQTPNHELNPISPRKDKRQENHVVDELNNSKEPKKGSSKRKSLFGGKKTATASSGSNIAKNGNVEKAPPALPLPPVPAATPPSGGNVENDKGLKKSSKGSKRISKGSARKDSRELNSSKDSKKDAKKRDSISNTAPLTSPMRRSRSKTTAEELSPVMVGNGRPKSIQFVANQETVRAVELGSSLDQDLQSLRSVSSTAEFMSTVKNMIYKIDVYFVRSSELDHGGLEANFVSFLQQSIAMRRAIWEIAVTNVKTTNEGFGRCQSTVEASVENLVQLYGTLSGTGPEVMIPQSVLID